MPFALLFVLMQKVEQGSQGQMNGFAHLSGWRTGKDANHNNLLCLLPFLASFARKCVAIIFRRLFTISISCLLCIYGAIRRCAYSHSVSNNNKVKFRICFML